MISEFEQRKSKLSHCQGITAFPVINQGQFSPWGYFLLRDPYQFPFAGSFIGVPADSEEQPTTKYYPFPILSTPMTSTLTAISHRSLREGERERKRSPLFVSPRARLSKRARGVSASAYACHSGGRWFDPGRRRRLLLRSHLRFSKFFLYFGASCENSNALIARNQQSAKWFGGAKW